MRVPTIHQENTAMTRPVALASAAALLFAMAATLAPPALAAGQVQVKWIEPEKFADAGRGSFDRERTLEALAEHLKGLGRQLPDGQTLRIEVTELELAGELEPFGRFHQDVRVLRGRADWPRISLRYSLSDGSRTLASGDADLSDPNYFFRSLRASHSGALGYEKRMLEDWVASLVAAKR
jgi:hypothetical protein